jgi:hypothetical protein
VVCNNTLRASFGDAAQFKQSHRSVFQADNAKAAIEAANAEFGAFVTAARELSRVFITSQRAAVLTRDLLDVAEGDWAMLRVPAGYNKILALFSGEAKGSNLPGARSSAWGWLNAVTDYVDHYVRARSDEHRFASAQTGAGAALKQKAVDLVTA